MSDAITRIDSEAKLEGALDTVSSLYEADLTWTGASEAAAELVMRSLSPVQFYEGLTTGKRRAAERRAKSLAMTYDIDRQASIDGALGTEDRRSLLGIDASKPSFKQLPVDAVEHKPTYTACLTFEDEDCDTATFERNAMKSLGLSNAVYGPNEVLHVAGGLAYGVGMVQDGARTLFAATARERHRDAISKAKDRMKAYVTHPAAQHDKRIHF